ncbi:hypothetical protein SAMN06265364_12551 [Prevotella jejuni]|uniref:Transcriptional repressor n=1 Tax=Prevotella jejuni TaxID=1177574 RepID=A0AA94LL13_9BACT|nr:hypothetical protein SAMN06265364_12551 [Prevotella jejuni]
MDSVYNKLKELGIRPSVQRVAIMNYLATHHTHPTVEEVFLQVPKRSAIKECPSPRDADVLDA